MSSPGDITPTEYNATEVSVQIGEFLTGEGALYDEDEISDGVWNDYWIVNRYESDGQIYMMPVTHPEGFDGDSVAFVKLAGGTLLWISDWTAEKTGAKPSIPKPDLQDENIVLLDTIVLPAQVLKRPSGEIIYRISGTYVYGFKNPSKATMYYSRPPWMDKSVDCAVSDSQFKDGILTCGTSEQSQNSPTNPDQVGSF
jgi:hypothetical protein